MSRAVDSKSRGGRRRSEHGGALVFVLIVMTAALFVAAMSINVGLSSRKASVRSVHSKSAFFCAETALERARVLLAANQGDVNTILGGGATVWYPVTGTCPDTAAHTYRVTIRDNADDADPTSDIDGMVIMDAVTYHATMPLATVSAMMQPSQDAMLSDYTTQAELGARKIGNK